MTAVQRSIKISVEIVLISFVTVSAFAQNPGDILRVTYLATDPPIIPWATDSVAVYYIEYWSLADGGDTIAGKLFVPVGEPPEQGWPVRVWLHGFGGPGSDFWEWPFYGNNWRARGYNAGMSYSNHGIVSLCPWVAGAGPSRPFATYSPLSLERNAQVAFDGFIALSNLPSYFEAHPELLEPIGGELRVDNTRQIMSTNCISSPTLIYFAAHYHEHPEVSGLRCLIADTFQPSVAYITHFLFPRSMEFPPDVASAALALWAGPIWCLADYNGWDKTLFFTPQAVELFDSLVWTPVGMLPLMRSARLEPLEVSDVGPVLLDAVRNDLGHEPTPQEIAEWTFSDDMLRLANYATIEEILEDTFYQRYFAQSDPFFAHNITPFAPDVPLFVIGNGDTTTTHWQPISAAEHFHNMAEPRIDTLRSWGWQIEVFFEEGVATTSMSAGPGHNWIMQRLQPFRDIHRPARTRRPSRCSESGDPVLTARTAVLLKISTHNLLNTILSVG